jgi:hypothetical protein
VLEKDEDPDEVAVDKRVRTPTNRYQAAAASTKRKASSRVHHDATPEQSADSNADSSAEGSSDSSDEGSTYISRASDCEPVPEVSIKWTNPRHYKLSLSILPNGGVGITLYKDDRNGACFVRFMRPVDETAWTSKEAPCLGDQLVSLDGKRMTGFLSSPTWFKDWPTMGLTP